MLITIVAVDDVCLAGQAIAPKVDRSDLVTVPDHEEASQVPDSPDSLIFILSFSISN